MSQPQTSIDPETVVEAIKNVYDPEIPINIYELGLIYKVDVEPETNNVKVLMTLTTPNCPSAQYIPEEVKYQTQCVDGVGDVEVDIVWDPPWDQSMMSEEALLQLGLI